MTAGDPDPPALSNRTADPRLLAETDEALPPDLLPPPALPALVGRPGLVGAGVTMTGASLLAGLALLAAGAADLVAGGGTLAVLALAVGAILVGTHWGWVHVAELVSQRAVRQAEEPALSARERWLESIEPYRREGVLARPLPDGGVSIERSEHRPVPSGPGTFRFERRVIESERHGPDEPAAIVAERAELIRRDAAAATERDRDAWLAERASREREAFAAGHEAEREAADRAAAEALAAQINAHLRSPPLD